MNDVSQEPGAGGLTGPQGRVDLARVMLRQAREDARWAGLGHRKPTLAQRRRAAPRRRGQLLPPPVTLSQVFTELLGVPGISAGLYAAWGALVGHELNRHLLPMTFDDSTGTLTVRASSKAWATQGQLLAKTLTSALNARLGQPAVTTMVVVVKPFAPADRRSTTAPVHEPLVRPPARNPDPADEPVRAAAQRLAHDTHREPAAAFTEALATHARRPLSPAAAIRAAIRAHTVAHPSL
jgi:hypothetical protein